MFQHVAQAVVFTKFAVIQAHAKLQSFANVSCAHTFAGRQQSRSRLTSPVWKFRATAWQPALQYGTGFMFVEFVRPPYGYMRDKRYLLKSMKSSLFSFDMRRAFPSA